VSSAPLSSTSDSTISPAAVQLGLQPATLLVLLTHILAGLERLRNGLAEAEVRIVGGSALILYEGDWARAEEAARALQESASSRYGVGIGPGEDRELDEDDDEEIEVEVVESGQVVFDTASNNVDTDSDEENQPPRLVTLSLIDFAHTRFVPGQGPDTGVLLGIDTLIRLVRERRDAIKILVADIGEECS